MLDAVGDVQRLDFIERTLDKLGTSYQINPRDRTVAIPAVELIASASARPQKRPARIARRAGRALAN